MQLLGRQWALVSCGPLLFFATDHQSTWGFQAENYWSTSLSSQNPKEHHHSCTEIYYFHVFFFYIFGCIFEDYLFLERGEGREKERERNINVWEIHWLVASCMPSTGDLIRNPDKALTWNWTSDLLVCKLALSPLGHTSQGNISPLKWEFRGSVNMVWISQDHEHFWKKI